MSPNQVNQNPGYQAGELPNLETLPTSLISQARSQIPALTDPALPDKVYTNFGGQGTLPQPALTALTMAIAHEQQQGPFSKAVNGWIIRQTQALRQALATHFQSTPDRFALTESTTAGMNIPLWGLDWQAGDELVIGDAEHPGVVAIAQRLAARFGIRLVTCDLLWSPDPVAALQAVLTPRSRMALISHVCWNTGRVMPLTELATCCHQHGVLLHCDAAQSAGVLPLDLPSTGVDFYAFTGHKWFCGPAGTGALYISAAAQAQILPAFTGWRALYCEAGSAAQFEVATMAHTLQISWQAAIAFHDHLAPLPQRYAQQVAIATALWSQLRAIPGVTCLQDQPPETGLVAFTLTGHAPADIEAKFEAQHIYLRCMPDPVCLRASVHYFTTMTDITKLVTAIRELMPG